VTEYFLIRTVSMGIGYDLASHCNSHNYHGTPKRRIYLLAIIQQHHHRISNSSSITEAVAAAASQHPLK